MKYAVFPGSLTTACHLGIFSELLNTGETPGQKAQPLKPPAPELFWRLVQSSFANVNLMKAILGFAWAVAVVMHNTTISTVNPLQDATQRPTPSMLFFQTLHWQWASAGLSTCAREEKKGASWHVPMSEMVGS